MLKTIRLCDRCGKEFNPLHVAISQMDKPKYPNIPHEDLSDTDLCVECYGEYIDIFAPRFESVHMDFIEWMDKPNVQAAEV